MEEIIRRLKCIKKGKLTERAFYEEVFTVLKDMEGLKFTEVDAILLRGALREIGCVTYAEWTYQKEKEGERIERAKLSSSIDKAKISAAVSIVSQLLGSYENASYAKDRMVEGGEKYGLVQQWLRESLSLKIDKENIPYYQVAREIMISRLNYSEDVANETIRNKPFQLIEPLVSAKVPIDCSIEVIAKKLFLTNISKKDLEIAIYRGEDGVNSHILEYIRQEINRPGVNQNEIIMDALFKVHDSEVEEHRAELMESSEKHKCMPCELIGWKDTKEYLIYIKPIFESIGVKIDEQALEVEYNNRVKEFFLRHRIKNSIDLALAISQGARFYPALRDCEKKIRDRIESAKYVDANIIPAIETNGIGKIEEVREEIVRQIADNPREEDITRLSEEEVEQIEQYLDGEIILLAEQPPKVQRKNTVVERIQEKAKRCGELRNAIAKQKAKSKGQETVQDTNS